MDAREKEVEKLKDYKYGFSTDIESITAPKGLNEEVIKFISNIKKEPKWMLDFRLKAFERFKLLKEPEEIKLANILSAVDEEVKTVQCKKESKKGCNSKTTKCITHNLWDELEIHINHFFEQKNLKDLISNSSESRN